jgi:hypothetical protein
MPVEDPSRGEKTHQIVRVVRAVRGAVRFRLECQPAFDYARRPHQISLEGRGAVFEASGMRFSLVSRFPLARQGVGVATEFLLHPGEPSTFVLRQVEGDGDSGLLEARLVGTELLTRTLEFWRRWLSKCRYQGRWREMVNRSALTLKLLTFAPTGAIVAAPTCSLPEEIGGVRNWDYRYTWVRDAAFTLYAFLRLGLTSEAEQFMGWLEQRAIEGARRGPLQAQPPRGLRERLSVRDGASQRNRNGPPLRRSPALARSHPPITGDYSDAWQTSQSRHAPHAETHAPPHLAFFVVPRARPRDDPAFSKAGLRACEIAGLDWSPGGDRGHGAE